MTDTEYAAFINRAANLFGTNRAKSRGACRNVSVVTGIPIDDIADDIVNRARTGPSDVAAR